MPHRFPFLMLDRICEIETGAMAWGEKYITCQSEGFPAILMIECIAQLAGIASGHQQGEGGFLAAIDHAQVHCHAVPGDLLQITARLIKSFGRLCLVEGVVECRGRLMAEATLTLGIGKL
ncbi:MAG TPA: hydroxymyristoyl-ACP dehydratase [Deltaproteobacteria bacterium]|nr:hydroxymyristoyl-ACP dehydratase [Deltaproteobacteria bacterium]